MDVEAFHLAAKERYWQGKDLQAARGLLGEGIALAREQQRPDLEKPLQYDLASFCWPGWDEVGISITAEAVFDGERAAGAYLRLARNLHKEGRPMANALFMIGAYDLAAKRYTGAHRAFKRQRTYAELAGDQVGAALAQGYAALARGLGLNGGSVTILPVLERLRTSEWEQGEAFAMQLETAARVFGR